MALRRPGVLVLNHARDAGTGGRGADGLSVLAELPEREARGEIAAIYDEIRRLWAVPYVSSLQRHLATRPGWLEWVWTALRPAFASGRAQTAAWRVTGTLDVPGLPPISRDALRVWGVDGAGEASIGAVCAAVVRVSPVNLVLAGLLRRLLRGERPAGGHEALTPWTPPPPIPGLPGTVDGAALPPAARGILASLGTRAGDERFVPGLYRMLARWPGFLAHVATVLRPHLDDPATRARCRHVVDAVDAEVPAVFGALPPLPEQPPLPRRSDVPAILSALDTYRTTSPEMIVFGLMIARALPPPEDRS
jgi:hypothetical protein